MPAELPSPSPELGAWLEENREPLIRRWLELVVERSTIEELAARPLSERVHELDLLLEAARARKDRPPAPAGEVEELDELGAALVEQAGGRSPFALALIAPPAGGPDRDAWVQAASETARREERVLGAPGGLVAVLIPASDPAGARVEADRIRAGAWQLLGGAFALPDVGLAMHPADATDAAGLVAVARGPLPEPSAAAEPAWSGEDHERPPADVTPLYPTRPR